MSQEDQMLANLKARMKGELFPNTSVTVEYEEETSRYQFYVKGQGWNSYETSIKGVERRIRELNNAYPNGYEEYPTETPQHDLSRNQ